MERNTTSGNHVGSLVPGTDAPPGNKLKIKPGIMWGVAENTGWLTFLRLSFLTYKMKGW